jgi:hypothetical protein
MQLTVNPALPSTRARLQALLDQLPPGPYVVQISPHGKPSPQQHRYYRAKLTEFCEHFGLDAGDMHTSLVDKAVVPDAVQRKNGQVRYVTPSSADLPPQIFSRLIETLHQVAAEAGYEL